MKEPFLGIKKFFCFTKLFVLSTALYPIYSYSKEYFISSPYNRLIGQNQYYTIPNDGNSLEFIISKFHIGLLGMLEANPDIDPLLPKAGKKVILPLQMLIPKCKFKGIVINLAELRMYFFVSKNRVIVYPVGIGQIDAKTPEMETRIIQMIKNPTWTPTSEIKKRYKTQGIILPSFVPSGPENPMGYYALRLAYGNGEYLIHGTNVNFGIGLRVSSGCIRLRSKDIEELFNLVSIGTEVKIINEPIKFSVEYDGSCYIEVHQPLSEKYSDDPRTMSFIYDKDFEYFLKRNDIDKDVVKMEILRRSGIPVRVNKK
ncbi:peptidoglycan-binding protein [Candidatus Riesia sp. GBBU]|nr:peptidoglycan-binding protein [Candidatus Riesia sp. GBBU]